MKVKGGVKKLVDAIFEGNSVIYYCDSKNTMSWEVTGGSAQNSFQNIYNWDTKKQVKAEAVTRIFAGVNAIWEKNNR